jgi:hypothetical protein
MTPSSFTFKLTLPNDPELAPMVADMARHAAEYVKLEGAAAEGFVERARSAAVKALKAAPGDGCLAVFTAADGELSIAIGNETIAQPLS